MEKVISNPDIMNKILSFHKGKTRRQHEKMFAPTIQYINDFKECYSCDNCLTLYPLCNECLCTIEGIIFGIRDDPTTNDNEKLEAILTQIKEALL